VELSKNGTIFIIICTANSEQISHQKLEICPPHLQKVATVGYLEKFKNSKNNLHHLQPQNGQVLKA